MSRKTRKSSRVSLPQKVKADIQVRLKSGWLFPGSPFPSEVSLAEEYKVSRMTARKAVLELVNEGTLYRVPGRGTCVSESTAPFSYLPEGIQGNVLVIVPTMRIMYFVEMVVSIQDVLARNGYEMVMRLSHDTLDEGKCIQRGYGADIHGTILIGGTNTVVNAKLVQEASAKKPFVLADIALEGVNCDVVQSDDEKGAYIATRHLIELGHKRIAHIAARKDRLEGYKHALSDSGIQFDPRLVRETHWEFNEGYSEVRKLFISYKDITAIFTANDELAEGAIKGLAELGISVPDDVAIVGYGNMEPSTFYEAHITTIYQNPGRIGKEAVGLLLGKISGVRKLEDFEKRSLDIRLITRSSCGIKNTTLKS